METFLMPDTRDELYLSYYGQHRCDPGLEYGPAVRDHYLLVYVSDGGGVYQANGKETPLRGGESFVLFPNVLTRYKADLMEPWDYKWIAFSGAAAGPILNQAGITTAHPVIRHRRPERISALIDSLLDYEPARDEKTDRLFYSGNLRLLLAELSRDGAGTGGGRQVDNRMIAARNFMQQHFDNNITASMVAEYAGMERSYFTKRFKAEFGRSPYDYILELRLAKGKRLLAQTDIPVEHLALLLGFNDSFHFSNFFKKRTGCAPLVYRKQNIGME
ncbi:AraC family transcriptional regulator [Paenibacillus cymbidii]|uniref:AraC family transcriptional regulator n=1 Tax=Paenibacillus cymbidii TaxID=1639034 RepID=UPI0010812D3C|nr:AraC family transcriptional regulator [Paenibacillus cymbidii]